MIRTLAERSKSVRRESSRSNRASERKSSSVRRSSAKNLASERKSSSVRRSSAKNLASERKSSSVRRSSARKSRSEATMARRSSRRSARDSRHFSDFNKLRRKLSNLFSESKTNQRFLKRKDLANVEQLNKLRNHFNTKYANDTDAQKAVEKYDALANKVVQSASESLTRHYKNRNFKQAAQRHAKCVEYAKAFRNSELKKKSERFMQKIAEKLNSEVESNVRQFRRSVRDRSAYDRMGSEASKYIRLARDHGKQLRSLQGSMDTKTAERSEATLNLYNRTVRKYIDNQADALRSERHLFKKGSSSRMNKSERSELVQNVTRNQKVLRSKSLRSELEKAAQLKRF